MSRIGIVGDGPGGLSAALFLSKAGHEVVVYGRNATAMNYAFLHNYLGVPAIAGSDFQQIARDQVTAYGAEIADITVTAAQAADSGFELTVEDGGQQRFDYLVLTEGKSAPVATALGVDASSVDRDGRTNVPGAYLVGRSARPARSQAIISAGDGAAAALDILSEIAGKDVQDWDTPPKGDAD